MLVVPVINVHYVVYRLQFDQTRVAFTMRVRKTKEGSERETLSGDAAVLVICDRR
jgi:hypothetical protein